MRHCPIGVIKCFFCFRSGVLCAGSICCRLLKYCFGLSNCSIGFCTNIVRADQICLRLQKCRIGLVKWCPCRFWWGVVRRKALRVSSAYADCQTQSDQGENFFTVVSNRKYVDLQNADEKDYPVSKYPIDAVGMSSDFV